MRAAAFGPMITSLQARMPFVHPRNMALSSALSPTRAFVFAFSLDRVVYGHVGAKCFFSSSAQPQVPLAVCCS